MKRIFNSILVVIALSIALVAQAQRYPVVSRTVVQAPYPFSLDEYVSGQASKVQLTLQVTDVVEESILNLPVKLHLVLTNGQVTVETDPNYINKLIYINANEVLTYTAADLAHLFQIDNLLFSGYSKNQYLREGRLPDGMYRLSFQVIRMDRPTDVPQNMATTFPATMYLFANNPPLLNQPRNKKEISVDGQQNIFFSWTMRGSPFASPGFMPEYKLELWEIYPDNLNENTVVRSTQPIFSTNTPGNSYVYTAADPLLVPGRKYAWRVTAHDPQKLAHFNDKGESKVYWFKYGQLCTEPTITELKAGPEHLEVEWETQQLQTGFTLRYRPVDNDGTWYSAETNYLSHRIDNLQSLTQYVVEVAGKCGSQNSEFSEQQTIETTQKLEFECGKNAGAKNITNKTAIDKLNAGDRIKAGDFTIEIGSGQGTGSSFTGTGYFLVPYFGFIKIEADLKGIKVNTDYQLIGGEIVSVYDLANSMVVTVGGLGGNNTGDGTGVEEHNDFGSDDNIVVTTKDSVTSVTVSGNTVTVVTASGETITETVSDTQAVVVTTGTGQDYVVDGGSGTVYVQSGAGGGTAPTGGSSGVKNVSTPAEKEFSVSFSAAEKQKYGFDGWNDKRPASNYTTMDVGGEVVKVPWKSVPSGGMDKVKASITGSPAKKVHFSRQSAAMVMESNSKNATRELMLSGQSHKDEDEVIAYYSKETTTGEGKEAKKSEEDVLAGVMKLVSYDRKYMKLVLVPANGSACPTAIEVQNKLNKIYAPAITEWQVSRLDGFTVDLGRGTSDTYIDNTDKDDRSDYTKEMKKVYKAFQKESVYDKQTVYLFFFDQAKDASVAGYFPFKQQFGFINGNPGIHIIAHEVGHGPFRLRHTFSNENSHMQNRGASDNIMDYAGENAISLYKYQWDFIHDPESMLFGTRQEEDEAKQSITVQIDPNTKANSIINLGPLQVTLNTDPVKQGNSTSSKCNYIVKDVSFDLVLNDQNIGNYTSKVNGAQLSYSIDCSTGDVYDVDITWEKPTGIALNNIGII
ncbi:MAG: hypothetical protein MI922_14465, partial [Bacteroidales bacterium]|nr:hypothetical protein [Bacteroidales bacterium]